MRKYLVILLLLIASILLLPTAVNAANQHIREGASGTYATTQCDTWESARACDDLPTNLVRGDTYWIADGAYARHVFADAESGETYITVKKATAGAGNHGSDTGWDDAYGDGQAVWGVAIVATKYEFGPSFRRGYYVFDGVVGSGDDPSTYGFGIYGVDDTKKQIQLGLPQLGDHAYQIDHITVSHTAIVASAITANCIYSKSVDGSEATNITLSNNYIYNSTSNILATQANGWVVANNYFDGNHSREAGHGQQISHHGCDDWIVRGNTFVDSYVFITGAHKPTNHRWQIYNNIVIGGELTAGWSNATADETDNVAQYQVHHNTHINVNFTITTARGAVFPGLLSDVTTDRSYAYNNIFYGCANPRLDNSNGEQGTVGGVVHNYNAFLACTTGGGNIPDEDNDQTDSEATSAIFTNYDEGDYSIAAANQTAIDHIIGKGKTLASPFDIDYLGVSRTAPYDIGAYDVGGSADTTAPTLAEVTPVAASSSNQAPSYVFSSDEAGTVTYGGTCGNGSLSVAAVGNNTTQWNLAIGTYSNCTITVTDAALNASTPLAVTEFVITPVISSASKVIESGVTFMRLP
jgi:hypothetical protein